MEEEKRISNLAALNTAFLHTTRRTERLRFLMSYAQGDSRWKKRLHHFARLIEKRSRRMVTRGWHRQERRCLKDNKYFLAFTSPACRGFIRRDSASPRFLELLQDPGSAFLNPGRLVVKDSKTTSCCMLPGKLAGKPCELFIKRYNYQNRLCAFKNLFRSSRAKRVWKKAQGLLARSIQPMGHHGYGAPTTGDEGHHHTGGTSPISHTRDHDHSGVLRSPRVPEGQWAVPSLARLSHAAHLALCKGYLLESRNEMNHLEMLFKHDARVMAEGTRKKMSSAEIEENIRLDPRYIELKQLEQEMTEEREFLEGKIDILKDGMKVISRHVEMKKIDVEQNRTAANLPRRSHFTRSGGP